MTLTNTQIRQFDRLYKLADGAIELPTIEIKFVNFWETLREDLGLAQLLLNLKQYAKETNSNKTKPEIPQTSETKTDFKSP